MLPFGNSIAQIQVTGAQVKEMFEMSVRSIPQKDENGTILLDDAYQPKLGANGGFYMFQAPFVSTMIPQNQVLAWLVTKAMKQDKRLSVVAY